MKLKGTRCWQSVVPHSCTSNKTDTEKYGGDVETPVYLNVYEAFEVPFLFKRLGLGAYHTGVEVYGTEYAYGGSGDSECVSSESGIFHCEPRHCPGYVFKKSVLIGTTDLYAEQVTLLMKSQGIKYYRLDNYHVLAKNCNHFTEDVCYKMTGKRVPKWVNRLARTALFCKGPIPDKK